MRLVHNSNSTMHLPVLLQARVAKDVGWDGIFVREEHVRRYLGSEAGTFRQLRAALDPLQPVPFEIAQGLLDVLRGALHA